MAPLQRALLGVVVQIFATGVITKEQRLSLASIHGGTGVSVAALEEVFEAFLRMTWGDVIDDEALTPEDWARLAMIIRELRLPVQRVPFPMDVLVLAS
jgi:hypothetical protein